MIVQLRPDVVIHAAAALHATAEFEFERNNVVATRNVLSGARRARTRRLVFCSTISIYAGDGPYSEESPTQLEDPYARSKERAEAMLRDASEDGGPAIVTFRLAGVHGPGRKTGVVHRFFEAAARGDRLHVREPRSRIRPVFLDDIVHAVLRVPATPTLGRYECFNVAGADSCTIGQLAAMILSLTGSRAEIIETEDGAASNKVMEIERARTILNYQPLSLREHLRDQAARLVP